MLIAIPDKKLAPYLKGKDYIKPSDEGEAIGIAVGYYLATKKRATVAMSADGLCNALCPLTSCVIPDKIKMNLVISAGRTEPQHIVMTNALENILKAINYDPKRISIKIVS